jgi:hypothetical protein
MDKIDDKFWDRADSFINLANDYCDEISRGKVSSSLLYAAARFNAFIVAASAESKEELIGDKESAIEYFVEQYRKMLEENLDDSIEKFTD